jgi:chromosome segregation ATPase
MFRGSGASVRAPQAHEVVRGHGFEAPDLAEGVTVLGGEPGVDAGAEPPDEAADEVGDTGGGGRGLTLPTSPDDQVGMHRGLLWVARAVEECGRAFTRLSIRLRKVERRLDAAELGRGGAGGAGPDPAVVDRLAQVEARVDENHAKTGARFDAVEDQLHQLESVPLRLTNLRREVDQLAVAARRAAAGAEEAAGRTVPVAPAAARPVDAEVRQLRREIAVVQRRIGDLDTRLTADSLSVLVEEAVRRQVERLAGELPSGTVDVEGVYRELDSVAEFVAARAATTAESLERVAAVEIAVLELRRDLTRALGELAAPHASRDADRRLADAEQRLQKLEATSRRIDRLYAALHDAVRPPEDVRSSNGDHR